MAETDTRAELDADCTELYRAHLRDVYSYAYYRIGNHHDAEDLTEQTFLQAWRHYRDRSRRPQTALDDADTISTLHPTEEIVEEHEELVEVLTGVTNLPDDRREALIMRFALGMDNREIARALGRSEGATKVLIHRALRQLEATLAEVDG